MRAAGFTTALLTRWNGCGSQANKDFYEAHGFSDAKLAPRCARGAYEIWRKDM